MSKSHIFCPSVRKLFDAPRKKTAVIQLQEIITMIGKYLQKTLVRGAPRRGLSTLNPSNLHGTHSSSSAGAIWIPASTIAITMAFIPAKTIEDCKNTEDGIYTADQLAENFF